ncbi:MAG: ubiquitin-specific protease 39 [Monoraphidium minutum]|nr:MAG: ubiquitin-specific protease 39 [Monoraphidium minutum]
MKRERDPDSREEDPGGAEESPAKRPKADAAAAPAAAAADAATGERDGGGGRPVPGGGGGDNGDEERIMLPTSTTRSAVKKGRECPYLDTISRQTLDFDFEKCCSVSLSPLNVYVCLVCGKYFQGRGLSTHAFTHALETNHHMFMKLDNGRVYCLPDNYEVVDRSLDDIRAVLNPAFTRDQVPRLDADVAWVRALDGGEYMPGLVGLNNMKANDYANVVLQVLARVTPIRDYFLVPANYGHCRSTLVGRFGELMRKVWNAANFKGQVSPHEFMQAVILASKRRFTIDTQSDPIEFWSWLLNALHLDLTGGKPKKRSVISDTFQGELEVTTLAGTGKGKAAGSESDVVERLPFLLLGLDLPATPLFKDAMEKNIIPQVPIFSMLAKFDGSTLTDDIKAGRRKFRVTRLPRFLALHFRRFTKNNFFIEKNPTLVTFPVKNLELGDVMPGLPKGPSKYDLVANVVHEGRAGQQTAPAAYKVHIQRRVEGQWYEVQDLVVTDILPQMVALSETYFQVYELKAAAGGKAAAAGGAAAAAGGGAASAGGGGGGKARAAAAAEPMQR